MKKDGTLAFVPIRELEMLRTDVQKQEEMVLESEETELEAGDGISFELKFEIDLEHTDAEALLLYLRCGEGRKTVCTFDFRQGQMSVNRNDSDGWSEGITRSVMYLKGKKKLDVHIFSDQSSLEIFTDDYTNNHSNNIFAGNEQKKISFCACKGRVTLTGIESYGLMECLHKSSSF